MISDPGAAGTEEKKRQKELPAKKGGLKEARKDAKKLRIEETLTAPLWDEPDPLAVAEVGFKAFYKQLHSLLHDQD